MADLGAKLPDVVMMEILSRVPPECLVRFRCVSKSWYALIHDPKFVCSLRNHQNVLLKRIVKNKETGKNEIRFSFLKYPLTVTTDDDDFEVEIEDAHFPSPSFAGGFLSIHGHSHGLLCLSSEYETIFLYNPLTRDLRKLPPSILLLPESNRRYNSNLLQSTPDGVGFGYDPKSMDFKVVRIVGFLPPGTDPYDYDAVPAYLPARAEVYHLKKDEWREIETPVPVRVNMWWWRPWSQLYYQGFYYWLPPSETLIGMAEIILWFDMNQEVFGQIPLPERFYSEDGFSLNINILNGSIVLLHHYNEMKFSRNFDIWKMEKLGDGLASWSKLFTIGPMDLNIHTALAFVGSGQLLMDNKGQLILYNIQTQRSRDLSLPLDDDVDNNPSLSLSLMADPDGLMMDILWRVPPEESLVRFRCLFPWIWKMPTNCA